MAVEVYVGMTADFMHPGLINIIDAARRYGKVTVGLLTDRAVATRKRVPLLSFEQRRRVLEGLVGVENIVEQESWDYTENLNLYRPSVMVHGDDWVRGPDSSLRLKCIDLLESYGGQLVEVPYTQGISSGALHAAALEVGSTPDVRRGQLRRYLEAKPLTRIVEVHSPLSAILAEAAEVQSEEFGVRRFDGFWSSSLTDSTLHGKPDIEAFDLSNRLSSVNQIFDVTSLPLVFDGDTGGKVEHFELNVRSIERLGVSAVIIEDKTGLKKNSLLGTEVFQIQEEPKTFGEKIMRGKHSQITAEFMIIARIESLILGAGLKDALDRAHVYLESGADALMIHSRETNPAEIFEFARTLRGDGVEVPLVCVPTSYNQVYERELEAAGFNLVIYANHLLRSCIPAMKTSLETILKHERSFELDSQIADLDEILGLIPGTR